MTVVSVVGWGSDAEVEQGRVGCSRREDPHCRREVDRCLERTQTSSHLVDNSHSKRTR
jgi:hypothetical protein